MLECVDFSLLDEVALATAEAVRGVAAATADAVLPVSGGVASSAGAGERAVGGVVVAAAVADALAGAVLIGAALAGAALEAGIVAAAVFGTAAFGVAALAGAFTAVPVALAGAGLADAFAPAWGAGAVTFFAAGALAGAAVFFGALAGDFDATLPAALVGPLRAAPTAVFFAGALTAFASATTVLALFTSPAPPFLAAPLAAAELLAFFAISFTSVAVAAGCYSPDALPQQPIFWDTVAWLTPADPAHIVTRLLLFLLSLYKRWLSPLLGAHCRFHPSCSDYARVAIARFGPWRGATLGAWRILRCQPLCEGGPDPVPEHFVLRRCGAHGAHTHD